MREGGVRDGANRLVRRISQVKETIPARIYSSHFQGTSHEAFLFKYLMKSVPSGLTVLTLYLQGLQVQHSKKTLYN